MARMPTSWRRLHRHRDTAASSGRRAATVMEMERRHGQADAVTVDAYSRTLARVVPCWAYGKLLTMKLYAWHPKFHGASYLVMAESEADAIATVESYLKKEHRGEGWQERYELTVYNAGDVYDTGDD